MFVQINHYFSPFVKLLSASRTNVGKTKIPHSPAKFFNACETRNSFCRSLSSVDFADQSAAEKLCDKLRRLGKWLFRVARNGVQHVWTCAGEAAVEDRKCTTGDPAKSEFLISNHFILRCSDNDALPHLTPGTNGFLHNLQWQLLKSIASAALVTLLWGRWSVAAL